MNEQCLGEMKELREKHKWGTKRNTSTVIKMKLWLLSNSEIKVESIINHNLRIVTFFFVFGFHSLLVFDILTYASTTIKQVQHMHQNTCLRVKVLVFNFYLSKRFNMVKCTQVSIRAHCEEFCSQHVK